MTDIRDRVAAFVPGTAFALHFDEEPRLVVNYIKTDDGSLTHAYGTWDLISEDDFWSDVLECNVLEEKNDRS